MRKALRYLKTVQGRPFKRTDDAFDALARLEAVVEAAGVLEVASRDPYDQERMESAWDALATALRALDEEQA